MGRFRLVVFDWDGTLADSTGLIARSIQRACLDVGEPEPPESAARYVIGLGLRAALDHVAPGLPVERHPQLARSYRDHYLADEARIPLFPGVREMLDELNDSGFQLAVATGKSRIGLEHAMSMHRLRDAFHLTRCGDEGAPKPDPDMLLHIMNTLAIGADETVMIGDTTHDIEMANSAGASGLAVTYGAHTPELLAGARPVAIADSVGAVRRWLLEPR